MSTRSRRLLFTVALVGVVATLAACSSSPGTSAPSGDSSECTAPAEITIGAYPVGSTLPTDVATGIGAFEEVEKACNTKISFQSFDAPQPMVAALMAGQIQFAVSNVQNQMLAQAQGQHVTALVGLAQGGNNYLIGNDSVTGEGIDVLNAQPDDATYIVNSTKGLAALVLSIALDAVGKDPLKAQLVQLAASAIPSAVANGTADLAMAGSPMVVAQAVDSGDVRFLFNTGSATMYDMVGFIPGWTVLSTPDFISQNSDLVTHITAAELKGLRFIQDRVDDPQGVYDVMPDSFKTATPFEYWEKSWSWNVSQFLVSGWLTKDDMVSVGEQMQKFDLLDPNYDLSALPDDALSVDTLEAAYGLIGESVPTESVDIDLLREIAP